jgi:predicted amino acid-binding ACT domain protein
MKLLIDFDALATNPTNALRKFTQVLTRVGIAVLNVESDGKTKKLVGVSYREATLTFADSQTLALKVKETGDVFEVRLNGKVVPVKAQDDFNAAAKELANLLDTGRAKFQKRLSLMQMRPPEGAKTAAPTLRARLQTQFDELGVAIEDATQELAALQAA